MGRRGGERGVFEICFGEYSQTNGVSFGMGLTWLICCSFGQNKLPLQKKTLDLKRSTQNTLTRHRRRKREGVRGGRAGRASVPDTFYCEGGQSPPPHFYTIINNFLLFFHGQLISIRTILENSSKQRVVCLNPNNVGA